MAAEGRALRALRHLSRSATGRAGSAPSSARATGRRPRASTPWAPSSCTARAASRARSTSAFPTRSTAPSARTGSYILMHGGCRSIGCYAMTNPVMDEIYALSEQALRQGQDRIQVHVFPFRMTDANLSVFADHKWHDFWLGLKEAYDVFEQTHTPPRIGICDKKYVVGEGAGPGRSRRASFPRNGHVGRPQHLRAGRGGGARAGLAARAHRHPPLRALHAPRAPLRRPQCPPRLRGGPPLARCRLRPAHAHHLGQLLASRPLRSTGPPLPSPAATPSDNQPSIALAERP